MESKLCRPCALVEMLTSRHRPIWQYLLTANAALPALSPLQSQLARMLSADTVQSGASELGEVRLPDTGAALQGDASAASEEFVRVRGMKDADGLPVKDPRTVALLVAKGVGTEAQVLDLLRSPATFKSTLYRFERCAQVYDLLESMSTPGATVQFRGARVPLAASLVLRQPSLLHSTPEQLSTKWALLQQAEQDGGLGFTAEQAAKLVRGHPGVLKKRTEAIQQRLAWLTALGLRDPRAILTRHPTLVGLALETLDSKVAVLRRHGLDVVAVVSAMPAALGLAPDTLDEKARLMRQLLGASAEEVTSCSNLFGLDVRQRMRNRVFLLSQVHPTRAMPPPRVALARMREGLDEFLRALLKAGAPPQLCTVAAYTAHIRGAEFQEYADTMEQQLSAKAGAAAV